MARDFITPFHTHLSPIAFHRRKDTGTSNARTQLGFSFPRGCRFRFGIYGLLGGIEGDETAKV
jgi:hypothetical protein